MGKPQNYKKTFLTKLKIIRPPIGCIFSGNLFRRNVVADASEVESPDECHRLCQEKKTEGCKYYVWENVTKDCVLYKGAYHIEYDKDPDEGKCIGQVNKCLGIVHIIYIYPLQCVTQKCHIFFKLWENVRLTR